MRRRSNATPQPSGNIAKDGTTSHATAKKPVAIVVGGGPSGGISAKALAEHGFTVRLFDSYAHPSDTTFSTGKSYTISISPRGQCALSEVGVNPHSMDGCVLSKVVARHGKKTRLINRDEASVILPRQKLASAMLKAAGDSGAELNFECKLVGVDVHKKVAKFEKKGESCVMDVPYDLLVGADGVNSVVRGCLVDQVPNFEVRNVKDVMGYQVAVLPGLKTLMKEPVCEVLSSAPVETVHAWADKEEEGTALSFPLEDGRTLFVVIYPEEKLITCKSEDGSQGYTRTLGRLFPDLTEEARSNIIKQFKQNDPANGGNCVWASSLAAPDHGIVLVGDSGHGMFPSLGQGCNAALESAACFAKVIDSSITNSDGIKNICLEFNKMRHDDATAAVDLTFGGFGGRNKRNRPNAAVMLKLQVAFMMILNKISFGIIPKPALLRTLGGEVVSYSKLKRLHFIYEKVAVVCTIAVPVVWFLGRRLFNRSF